MAMEYAIRYPDRVAAVVLRDTAADNTHAELARTNALASDRVSVDMEKFDRIDEGRVRDNADLMDCWREILPLYDFTYDPEATERKVQATPYRYEAHNYAFSVNLKNYDLKEQLPSISVPTLVTVGRVDWITPVSCSETIASLIPERDPSSVRTVRALAPDRGGRGVDKAGAAVPAPGLPAVGERVGRTLSRNALKALDELDRQIVVALQRDGRASWTGDRRDRRQFGRDGRPPGPAAHRRRHRADRREPRAGCYGRGRFVRHQDQLRAGHADRRGAAARGARGCAVRHDRHGPLRHHRRTRRARRGHQLPADDHRSAADPRGSSAGAATSSCTSTRSVSTGVDSCSPRPWSSNRRRPSTTRTRSAAPTTSTRSISPSWRHCARTAARRSRRSRRRSASTRAACGAGSSDCAPRTA